MLVRVVCCALVGTEVSIYESLHEFCLYFTAHSIRVEFVLVWMLHTIQLNEIISFSTLKIFSSKYLHINVFSDASQN